LRRLLRAAPGGAAALVLLEASRAAAGIPFSPERAIERAAFIVLVLALSRRCRPARGGRVWTFPGFAAAALSGAALAGTAAAAWESDAAAWLALALFWAVGLGAAAPAGSPARSFALALRVGFLAAAAGAAPMIAVEIESGFAHEELFVAAEAVLLAAAWLALVPAGAALARTAKTGKGVRLPSVALGAAAGAISAAALVLALARYQRSFFDPAPPGFRGISAASPFLCGESPADRERYDGGHVFDRLLAAIDANPDKGPPEQALLALATRDPARASLFRRELLSEVDRGELSRRGRTKFWQYAAALRAHYYARVRSSFPALFSLAEQARIGRWFAEINRRALRVGWDDLVYAAAYGKRPEGPYENQENGAGLLAALESGGLSDPRLSAENRRYLDRAPRGWSARWRNSDDALSYQSEWITNAWLQARRTGAFPPDAVRRSFEWLLLQAPPDGFDPDYDPSGAPALPTAYLGAGLLDDPKLVWLAARNLESAAKTGRRIWAQPGIEGPVRRDGVSPTAGNCLLFGPSGTPTAPGPLAPDKIVLRSGWRADDAYLLANLRFEGWHRYKATNTVTLLRAAGETLVTERGGAPYAFLPLERRLFRDKRIPREALNGLLVEPTGYAAAVERLTGFGGRWAQDPPRTARVDAFDPSGESRATIRDWRGWTQRREIAFGAGAPLVIVDDATGPPGGAAALAWHVEGVPAGPGRFRLGAKRLAQFVLVPLDGSGTIASTRRPGSTALDVLYRPRSGGRLRVASVFLIGAWADARVSLARDAGGPVLEVAGTGGTFRKRLGNADGRESAR